MAQRIALGLLLLIMLVAPYQSQPAQANNNTEYMGMVIRDPWYEYGTNPAYPNAANQAFLDQMGQNLADAGVQWVRFEFHIPLAANDAQVQAEIAKNDYFIKTVAPRHNLKILGLLGFDLLRGSEAELLNTGPFTVTSKYGGGINQYMKTWLDRSLAIADHYRNDIHAYQILNEQNRLPPSGKAITPEIFGRLQTKFYRFCKNIDPTNENHGCTNAKIIMGGLHPRGTLEKGKNGYMTDAEYLKRVYNDINSFGGFYQSHGYYPNDAVAYHPYPEEIRQSLPRPRLNPYVEQGMGFMRQALKEIVPPSTSAANPQKPACQPLWITEIGVNEWFDIDGPKNPTPPYTEQDQVQLMNEAFTYLPQRMLDATQCGANQREIENIFWFKYEDFPPVDMVYDSKGNPITYPQRWGIVRIPMPTDRNCEGGCYAVDGVPEFYRRSYWEYRKLAGKPVYEQYLPNLSVVR